MGRPSLAPGEVLADKYRLISQVGAGGMGEVWRAEHQVLRSQVAIKVILAELVHPDIATRFVREAQAAAALRSPYVVQILDYGVDRDMPFMVMELLEGESLAARLDRHGCISAPELSLIFSQVGRAVGKAHEAGIVHRDLKPENIFLTFADDEMIAKVLDFGIAKFQTPMPEVSASTRTGALVGTPYYMSPEQAEGQGRVDARSDIWSLGVIAFQCLTGRRPFDSDALGDLLMKIMVRPLPMPSQYATVPPGFDEWFARAVCRDPAGRFQTVREASEALQAVCGQPGVRTVVAPLRAPQAQTLPIGANAATPAMGHTAEPLTNTVSPTKKSVVPLVVLGLGALVLVLGLVSVTGLFIMKRSGEKSAAGEGQVEATPGLSIEAPPQLPAPTPSTSAPAPAPSAAEAGSAAPTSASKPAVAPTPNTGSAKKTSSEPKTAPPATGTKKPAAGGPTKPEEML